MPYWKKNDVSHKLFKLKVEPFYSIVFTKPFIQRIFHKGLSTAQRSCSHITIHIKKPNFPKTFVFRCSSCFDCFSDNVRGEMKTGFSQQIQKINVDLIEDSSVKIQKRKRVFTTVRFLQTIFVAQNSEKLNWVWPRCFENSSINCEQEVEMINNSTKRVLTIAKLISTNREPSYSEETYDKRKFHQKNKTFVFVNIHTYHT